MTEHRLERIEEKVDKLVDSMVSLVRLEEKFQSHSHGVQRIAKRLDTVEEDVSEIKKKMPLLDVLLTVFGKIGLAVISLIVIGIVGSFFVFK